MRSVIVVHPDFDRVWPFAANRFRDVWEDQGRTEFVRLEDGDARSIDEIIDTPETVQRMVALGVPVTERTIEVMTSLREATSHPEPSANLILATKRAGIHWYRQPSEGYWGQSVAEFALALTLCGLRRIPQLHAAIVTSQHPWSYTPPDNKGRPGARGVQFGDDPRFTNGTLEGKRVRIVGAGNIASRYASFARMMGADVAAWDPYASEPCFHRAGARRELRLDHLVKDAEIFAPMVPLTESTRGIVTPSHIDALPQGCLVVLATRARICDMDAIRRRVLRDELSLAADVFDVEPLPLDDPLLDRPNVVHTPHNAGRTIDANREWADRLALQFSPTTNGH